MIGEDAGPAPQPARAPGLAERAGSRVGRLAWPAVVVVLSIGVLSPGIVRGPSLDAAVFALIGRGVRGGQVPYLDLWDHKPPGIYLVDAAAQAVLPFVSPWVASWLVSVVGLALTGLLVERLVRSSDSGSQPRLVAAVAVVAAGGFPLALGGGLTETMATPFAALGFLLLVRAGARARDGLLAGALLGAAILTSLQLIPALAAAGVVALSRRPLRRCVEAVLGLGIGGASVAGLAGAWLALRGALPAAYDALVTYEAAYVRVSWSYDSQALVHLVLPIVGFIALLVPLLMPGPRGLGRRFTATTTTRACTAWLVATAALLLVQQRVEAHYLVPAVVPLAVLAAPGLRIATRRDEPPRPRSRLAQVTTLVAVEAAVLMTIGWTAVGIGSNLFTGVDAGADRAVGAWLQEQAPANGTIFVWGAEPSLYLAADRRPASRYLYSFPLTTPGYSSEQQVADLAADLARNPPDAIVDAGSPGPGLPGLLPLLLSRPLAIQDGRTLDVLTPLREYVIGHYRLDTVVDGWAVYVPR